MITQMMFELSSTYLIVSGEEIEKTENYRYKMLSANNIPGILPLEIRQINNDKKIYIDITGKENLCEYFKDKTADRAEIKKLYEAIYIISEEISKFLIGETDVILRPEMIFKNLSTNEFEFVCIPLVEEGMTLNEGMRSLMHFLLDHLDNGDEQLVSTMYSINEMFEKTKPKFSLIYEFFVEETRDEEPIESYEESNEPVKRLKCELYIPCLREVAAFSMCLVGIVLIGYNVYLSMLR